MNSLIKVALIWLLLVSINSQANDLTDLKKIYQSSGLRIGQKVSTKQACGSNYNISGEPDESEGRAFVSCEMAKDSNQVMRVTIEGGRIAAINLDNRNYPVVSKSISDLDKIMSSKSSDSFLDSSVPLKMYYGKFDSLGFMYSATISTKKEAKFVGFMVADCKSEFVKKLVPIEKACKK